MAAKEHENLQNNTFVSVIDHDPIEVGLHLQVLDPTVHRNLRPAIRCATSGVEELTL